MATPADSKIPPGPRRSWTGRISLMGVSVAVAGTALATVVGRATGAGWLPAIGLAILLGVALYLWARDEKKGWGDLGEGIMVSVIVAIALMAVQRDADDRTREATERRDRQLHDVDVRRERQIREAEEARQQVAERESLQVSLTMQTDLRGIALADRDLHGFFLAGKNFADADLHGANLKGADLRGSRFPRTNLLGANLDKAKMFRANLRSAILQDLDPHAPTTLRGADLTFADLQYADVRTIDFTGAALISANVRLAVVSSSGVDPTIFRDAGLIYTDFRGSRLSYADLRGATLGGAIFCGVRGLQTVKLDGATYDETTRWPPGFNPKTRGAEKVRGNKAIKCKIGGTPGTHFAASRLLASPRPNTPACTR